MSDSSLHGLWLKVNEVADYLAPRIVASSTWHTASFAFENDAES
jgi:hypothetical protein